MSQFSDPPAVPQPPVKSGPSVAVILLIVGGGVLVVMLICGGILVALLAPAIGKARDAARKAAHRNDLRQLGVVYFMHIDMKGQGPQSWDDLRNDLGSEAVNSLVARKFEVVWGLRYEELDGSSLASRDVVLAYPNDPALVSEESVSVLMADGSVADMHWSEIQGKLDAWQAEQSGGG